MCMLLYIYFNIAFYLLLFGLMSPYQTQKGPVCDLKNTVIVHTHRSHSPKQPSFFIFPVHWKASFDHNSMLIEIIQITTFSNHISVDMGCPVLIMEELLILTVINNTRIHGAFF